MHWRPALWALLLGLSLDCASGSESTHKVRHLGARCQHQWNFSQLQLYTHKAAVLAYRNLAARA